MKVRFDINEIKSSNRSAKEVIRDIIKHKASYPRRKNNKIFWLEHQKLTTEFYSTIEWRELRNEVIKYNGNLCNRCCKQAEEIHHIESIYSAPEKALDKTNLDSLCSTCHKDIHKLKLRNR